MKKPVVTIDGPAGSGKSTTAKRVARKLGYTYLDTGAMYRAMTVKALKTGIDLGDPDALARQARETDIAIRPDPDGTRVILDGIDVTDEIRTPEVTQASSPVSAAEGVRKRMVELQRQVGEGGGIVAEGRDMGSVVFKDAEVKIYLDASLACRAARRKKELEAAGTLVDFDNMEKDIESRDAYDSSREHSPLVIPEGSIIVDTTDMTIEDQVDRVIQEVKKRTGE
ncbi:(d)CMP kinase [Candidatus Eisenbacteria bacterium]|uniref:Cytidylate kinase n=1 Tax=Eiseniibacteriota bacterium TaxID=2212470 RepID=A0ABV6YQP9_UNCEI